MPQTTHLTRRIFEIHTPDDFNGIALELFHFQLKHNSLYNSFVKNLPVEVDSLKHFSQIPCLPIGFFKSHRVKAGQFEAELTFTSSGTSGAVVSRHDVKDVQLYHASFLKTFNLFYGAPDDYVILALLPSYLEREGSSLVYMVDMLMKLSKQSSDGFFLYDHEALYKRLRHLKEHKQKVMLFGVSFALLDFVAQYQLVFPELIVVETGGMKGRRKEILREELHERLKQAFGIAQVHSEYGMTELMSQAYAMANGFYNTPPWMEVLIRDPNDPLSLLPEGRTGGINVIDLANINSCPFIATQDLGKKHGDGRFEVLGRFDNSDIRGCNLMVE